MKNDFFDEIAIIGDGITAKLVAIAFYQIKIMPILISNNKKKIYSNASISISNHSQKILSSYGIDIKKKANPIHSIKLYEQNYRIKEDVIFFNKKSKQPLSFVILKNDLEKILDENINNKFKIIKSRPKQSSLVINTINSPAKKISWNYNEKAFTFLIKHTKLLNFCARQLFVEAGPIAFLPLDSNITSVVFSISESSILIETLNNKILLEKYLNKNFPFLKNIKVISKVENFPLKFDFLTSSFFENEIYLGDIAHRIHPIAGQGWNMTVRDVHTLHKIYKEKIKYGYNLSDKSILKDFEKKTKVNNLIFAASIDLIRKTFKLKYKKISVGRKKVFNELDTYPELKREIIKFADKGLNF